MSLRQQSTLVTPIIAAGQTLPLNITGRYCYLVDAPGPVEIKVGEQPASRFSPGTGVEFEQDSEFQRIEVKNPNAYPMAVSLWIGYARYLDRRLALLEPETIPLAWPGGPTLAANDGVTLIPALELGRSRRKCLIVDNQDPTLPLYIRDTAGTVLLHVRAENTITLPISTAVEVFNPHGAPIACSITEIYWTQ